MASRVRGALILALCLGLPRAGPALAGPLSMRILGRWRGTSICVKAASNAACNDEQVIYHFARAAQDSSRFTLHAEKRAGTVYVPMYDLELGFERATDSWVAEFTNARVHVLWSYRVDHGRLVGRLVDIPSGRLLRNVSAVRDSL